jgi:hypothetical protein
LSQGAKFGECFPRVRNGTRYFAALGRAGLKGQAAFSVAYGIWLCTGDVANYARQHRQRLDRRMCAIEYGGTVTPIATNALETRPSRYVFFAT